jgi:hypothetical protein
MNKLEKYLCTPLHDHEGELNALRAEVEACREYLKDGETPADAIKRNRDDWRSTLRLLATERAEVERLRAALEAAPEPAEWMILDADGKVIGRVTAGSYYERWHTTTRAEALRRE